MRGLGTEPLTGDQVTLHASRCQLIAHASRMGTPFRIPKTNLPSKHTSVEMQSPLSRLQDGGTQRAVWTPSPDGGRKAKESVSQSGNLRGHGWRAHSRAGAERWRPKRASDSLCQDENLQESWAPPSPGRHGDVSGQAWRHRYLQPEEREKPDHLPERETEKPDRCWGSVTRATPDTQDSEVDRWDGTGRDTQRQTSTVTPPRERERCHGGTEEEGEDKGVPHKLPRRSSQGAGGLAVPDGKGHAAAETMPSSDPIGRHASPAPCRARERTRSLRANHSAAKRAKPVSTEPIVLSSDEERADEDGVTGCHGSIRVHPAPERMGLQSRALSEGRGGSGRSPLQSAPPEATPSIMELPFTQLHIGSLRAQANGTIVITDEGISIPLKGPQGEGEVAVAVVPSELHGYGMWDGALVRDEPSPSLLFLAVSGAQARLIHKELLEIQPTPSPGATCQGPAGPFLLLVLSGPLEDLQAALLASLMDLLSLRSGRPTRLLSRAQGLSMLHQQGQNRPILTLLGQEPHTLRGKSPAKSSAGTALLGRRTSTTRNHGNHQDLPRRLIQFPPPPSKGGITVTTEDLACLNRGEFLNDVIIDFYLKYLLLEMAEGKMAARSHIFSSFFFKQLTRKDNAGDDASGSKGSAQYRRHQRVRTWTRHVDIFTKDFLFVPVNQEAHWYLVVICFPGLEQPQRERRRSPGTMEPAGGRQKLQPQAVGPGTEAGVPEPATESPGSNDVLKPKVISCVLRSRSLPDCTQQSCQRETVLQRPCILVMDSLKLSYHDRVDKLLREYLQVEWEVRRGSPRSFSPSSMASSVCRVPLQDNSSDCGLYLLQYAESFLQNPVVHFDPPIQLEHWFPRQQVRRKREELRNLVLQLYRSQGGGANRSTS